MDHMFSVITYHLDHHQFMLILQPTYQYKVCSESIHSLHHVPHIPSAPPAAPTNLTNTPINATSTVLAWGPLPVQSPSLLSYVVEVINRSGVLVYRGTVTVPQVTITTPDPCDQYEATVSAQYMMPNHTCTGNSSSSKSLGGELLQYLTPYKYTQIWCSILYIVNAREICQCKQDTVQGLCVCIALQNC